MKKYIYDVFLHIKDDSEEKLILQDSFKSFNTAWDYMHDLLEEYPEDKYKIIAREKL
jgi:hypothetical protein